MKASHIKKSLKELIKQKIPLFIWGSPGIGKSSIVKQVADEEGLEFIDLRLTLMDPTDLKGIPFFDKDNNEAVWAKPNFLPKDPTSCGILFLDEINTAPPSVQASAYQLVLDRKVGDYELPDGWSIVAAGNNESDRGVIYRMPSPLANRFVHLDMEVSFKDWKSWAYQSGISDSIIAFLGYDDEKLFAFDPSLNEKSFPTPRSWEYVDRILKSDLDEKYLYEAICGAVGRESGVEFLSFKKVMDKLPNLDDIFKAKITKVGDDNQTLFALISALVSNLKKDPDSKKIENTLNFSHSLSPEFAVLLIKDMQQNGIPIETNPAWDKWVERFNFLL